MHDHVSWRNGPRTPLVRVAAANASLPMVHPSAMGKAFGLAAAMKYDRV
jgi:hypothetical protein